MTTSGTIPELLDVALSWHRSASEKLMRSIDDEYVAAAEYAAAESEYAFALALFERDAWNEADGKNAETRKAQVAAAIVEAQQSGPLGELYASQANRRGDMERARADVAIEKVNYQTAAEQLRSLTAAVSFLSLTQDDK